MILQVRASKAEEEVAELVKKAQQLEVELDKTKEELATTSQKLEDKEKALLAAEMEVNTLNRSIGGKLAIKTEIGQSRSATIPDESSTWKETWRSVRTNCCWPLRNWIRSGRRWR